MKKDDHLSHIGWREWVELPDLAISRVKAKVDTGARTSALHAFDMEYFRRGGKDMVRFKVHPKQRDAHRTIRAEAEVFDRRYVRNSGGKQTLRPVIKTNVKLMDSQWPIELTLVGRDEMGFRMLLGRQAIRGRHVVDPGASYLGGKPKRRKKKRNVSATTHGHGASTRTDRVVSRRHSHEPRK